MKAIYPPGMKSEKTKANWYFSFIMLGDESCNVLKLPEPMDFILWWGCSCPYKDGILGIYFAMILDVFDSLREGPSWQLLYSF